MHTIVDVQKGRTQMRGMEKTPFLDHFPQSAFSLVYNCIYIYIHIYIYYSIIIGFCGLATPDVLKATLL